MDKKQIELMDLLIEKLKNANLRLSFNMQLMLLTTKNNIIPNVKEIITTSELQGEEQTEYEKKLVELASKFDEEIKTYDKEKLNYILKIIFCILTYVSLQNDLFKQAYLQNLLVDNKQEESIFDKIFYALIPACATDESNEVYNKILEIINEKPSTLYNKINDQYPDLVNKYKTFIDEQTNSDFPNNNEIGNSNNSIKTGGKYKKTKSKSKKIKSKSKKTGGKKRRKRSKKMYY
jgi:hypothetical protein